MIRREFVTGAVAATVAVALAGVARKAQAAENFCRGCDGPIWRGTRAYLLAPLGHHEQDDYCVSCLSAINRESLLRSIALARSAR